MMFMLRMILKWNVDDVGNALACACCVCSWGALCTDLPGSLALTFGHDHTSYGVYVIGGRVH